MVSALPATAAAVLPDAAQAAAAHASCNTAAGQPDSTAGPHQPQTAVAAHLLRIRRRVWRSVVFMAVLCTGIAALLATLQPGRFGVQLLYSACIGTCCSLAVDGMRLAMDWLSDTLRARRGLPPSTQGLGSGWRGVVPAVLVAVVVGPSAGLWLGDRFTGFNSPGPWQLGNAGVRVTLVLTLLGTAIAVFAFSTLERLSTARAEAEAARRLAAENQLRLLQSQLEPHMLFNTLANLRVLIGLDPLRAQAMLDHLIAFLRGTLSASRADSHPLRAEFAHMADYLALMTVRMGARLQTQLVLPPELATLPLPPLLLQPLVENAIQHGLEPKVAGGRISVTARRLGDTLELCVRDTGIGLRAAAARGGGTSFGLQQVRARLATLYGPRASLELLDAGVASTGAGADGDADADADHTGTLARIVLPIAPNRTTSTTCPT